jgi:hypothetical protein
LIKVPSIKQIGLVAVVVIVAVGGYAYFAAAPSCISNQVQGRASELLRSQFNLDSVFFNNIQEVSGNVFGDRRECTAQVTQIKGNISPTAMSWRQLRYTIAPGTEPDLPDIKIDLGSSGPYVPPPPTLWERIFGLSTGPLHHNAISNIPHLGTHPRGAQYSVYALVFQYDGM